MNRLIKWPGGKYREIDKIEPLIPEHKRYVEPFFGGGALFFNLTPPNAAINDISESLIQYYQLIKKQDKQLYDLLSKELVKIAINKHEDKDYRSLKEMFEML